MANSDRKAQAVYMVRHQAAGILTSHVFKAWPSEAQVAALVAECERLHGKAHPKTGDAYWVNTVEVPLLDGAEVPKFPERAPASNGKKNTAGVPEMTVSGVGTVVDPGE
jgi:hypothetical protein